MLDGGAPDTTLRKLLRGIGRAVVQITLSAANGRRVAGEGLRRNAGAREQLVGVVTRRLAHR
ncbi:MAG: hypothetical protein AUH85_03410 [Chloroflexi bacterium 13_1_40CM_4_68_4]|nr:MAG: hypothetical protein AUH85_03410 [Chloroflexi bacterium 13_1_40CM_4_68_4]